MLWLWGVNKTFFFKVRPAVFLNQNFHALTQSFSFLSDRPSTFWPSPSRFLLFLVFVLFFFFFWVGPSVFWLSLSRFIEPDLHYFDLFLPVYWVSPSGFTTSPSHFLSQSLSIFKVQFFEWILLFWLQTYHVLMMSVRNGFGSVLPFFFTASFLLLPVLRSDLIGMCTVNKIKNGGVCRKRLLHFHERRRIEIVLLEKLVKKLLRDKQVREKNKTKWQLCLLTLIY